MMAVLLVLLNVAHAGFFSDLCHRYLIKPDAYEFEETSEGFLHAQIERLEIKQAWGRLSPEDLDTLHRMRAELEKRAVINEILTRHVSSNARGH